MPKGMKNMRTLLLMIFAALSLSVSAQTITLNGNVKDTTGEPIIGASIVEKGNTTNGTITDLDGNFSLKVPANATVVISYIGMKTQEIAIKGKSKIDVTLSDDAKALDEVVVIGYGTAKRKDITNANADNTSSTAFCVKNNEVSTKDLLVSLRFPILDDYSFVQSAQDAYQSVLLYAGASNLRDKIDKRIVKETQEGTFTYTGSNGGTNGLIDTQADVEGWSEYASTTTTQQDSDKDGIPDEWETANGLNPNDGSDGNKYNLSKEYTNLEVYLNSLVNSLYPTNN